MSKLNFISCVTFVKKGVAKEVPEKIQLTEDELKRAIGQIKEKLCSNVSEDVLMQSDDSDNDGDDEDADIINRYNLGNYDSDDDDDEAATANELANMTYYASNSEDPYLDRNQPDGSDDDMENHKINPSDNLVLVGHVEKDAAILEVHVYNQDDLYVHHDVILPAYPMCFAWLNYDSNKSNCVNYVAVGDMTSDICIWDLDIVNSLEPVTKLIGHHEAVLDLSWNKLSRTKIASGSADHTVLLWNLETSTALHKFDDFGEKVQALEFHTTEMDTLVAGDCRGVLSVIDCSSKRIKRWTLPKLNKGIQEIEHIIWNRFDSSQFLVSTDAGQVYCYDFRGSDEPVYTISAHSDAVTGLSLSSSCPGLLVTASSDKTVKIWDIHDKKVAHISSYDIKVGSILALDSNPDCPYIFGVGGDRKSDNFRIIDLRKNNSVKKHFKPRMKKSNEGNRSASQ